MGKRCPSASPPSARKRPTSATTSGFSSKIRSSTAQEDEMKTHTEKSESGSSSSSAASSSSSSRSTRSPTSGAETTLDIPRGVEGRGDSCSLSTNTSATTESVQSSASSANSTISSKDEGNMTVSYMAAEALRKDHTTAITACLGAESNNAICKTLGKNATPPTSAMIPYYEPDTFPFFRDGDVIITSKLSPVPLVFQLHSAVLARHSSWFANSFQEMLQDRPQPPWYSYIIEKIDGVFELIGQPVNGDRPTDHESDREGTSEVKIKTEGTDNDRHPIHTDFYSQIFGAMYNIPLQVSSTDLGIALIQAEGVVNIASKLDCLHLIRCHLSTAFAQYRQKLFVNIKFNPPRWILLAMTVGDTSIYTEALIHLIGAHPNWPWTTKRATLPPELLDLIVKKSEELDQLCLQVDRDLFMITIEVGHEPVSCQDLSQLETWLTVQLFRNSIAEGLCSHGNSTKSALKRGKFYRKIQRGGPSYLEYEEVLSQCRKIIRSDWSDLGNDLKDLKAHASEIVGRLGANELMIDPDVHGIGYLTCAKIQPEDIPWARPEYH